VTRGVKGRGPDDFAEAAGMNSNKRPTCQKITAIVMTGTTWVCRVSLAIWKALPQCRRASGKLRVPRKNIHVLYSSAGTVSPGYEIQPEKRIYFDWRWPRISVQLGAKQLRYVKGQLKRRQRRCSGVDTLMVHPRLSDLSCTDRLMVIR
jgi:hypothetical protein